jgi:hypothetical protein
LVDIASTATNALEDQARQLMRSLAAFKLKGKRNATPAAPAATKASRRSVVRDAA